MFLDVFHVGASQLVKVRPFLKCNVVGRNEMKAPDFQLFGTVKLKQKAKKHTISTLEQ